MSDDLVKRLREVGGISDDGATRWYINPDGPEAASRIEKLEAQLAQSQLKRWAARWEEQADRIEKLEAALLEAALRDAIDNFFDGARICEIACKALEGKDD